MVKISVIIPVFNVEDYLSECLDSVLNQSFKDIEIICINDGSTDKSLEILEKYQKNDGRFKIITQENQGPGSARNRGLDNAQGEYVIFLDSDDYFEKNTFTELYSISKEMDVDFLMFKILNFDNQSGETSNLRYFDMPFLKEFNGKTFNYRDLPDFFRISVTTPGKIFKTSFINQLRFPENIIFEDTPFIVEAVLKAKRMMFLDEYYYMRRVRSDSITQSNFKNFADCIEIFNMLCDISKKYNVYSENKENLFERKYLNIARRFLEVEPEYKDDFFNKIKTDINIRIDEVKSDIDFAKVKPKAVKIYNSALNCSYYKEFELKITEKNKQKKSAQKSFLSKVINFIKN